VTAYTAKKGERLDQIIFANYGSLAQNILDAVIELNTGLLDHIELKGGERVLLPRIEESIDTAPKKGSALW